jgi:helix-turn-helix protein
MAIFLLSRAAKWLRRPMSWKHHGLHLLATSGAGAGLLFPIGIARRSHLRELNRNQKQQTDFHALRERSAQKHGPVFGGEMKDNVTALYPLLHDFLSLQGMSLQPTYTIRDVAKLFGVTPRAIHSRVSSGQLASRNLPGRAKFLSRDLEDFLQQSKSGGPK